MLSGTPRHRTSSRPLLAAVALAATLGAQAAAAQPSPPATAGWAPRAAPMVEVPAGPFLMGSAASDRHALARERPQRTIELSTYRIDVYEVTNARYELCVQAGVCAPARVEGVDRKDYYKDSEAPLQPVVGVTLADAKAYCAWVGRRLPTEAEWEKAARGPAGGVFPWGDDPPSCELANYNKCGMVAREPGLLHAGQSPYGALDMAGNVIEWTSTPYTSRALRTMPAKDPPDAHRPKAWHVVRGGSWGSYSTQCRAAMRRAWKPGFAGHTIGFRCAASGPLPGAAAANTEPASPSPATPGATPASAVPASSGPAPASPAPASAQPPAGAPAAPGPQ